MSRPTSRMASFYRAHRPAIAASTLLIVLLLLLGGWIHPAVSSETSDLTYEAHPAEAPAASENGFGPRRHHHDDGLFGVSFSAAFAPQIMVTKVGEIINDDGDGIADPGETIRYTVTISNTGNLDATSMTLDDTVDPRTTLVPGSQIMVVNDVYQAIGNVGISVPAGSGILINDVDPDGGPPSLAVSTFDATSTNGGAVNVAGDGGFTYDPPPGFEGTDTFTYEATDGDGFSAKTYVSILVSDMIWFIDNDPSAPPGNDGRLHAPFNALAAFEGVNGNGGAGDPKAGDCIFIYETSNGDYTGGVTLENNQDVLGQGATVSLDTFCTVTLPAFSNPLPSTSGANPTVAHATGNGISLGQGNVLRGLDVGDTPTGVGIVGTNFVDVEIVELSLTGTGGAVSLTNGALDITLDALSSSSAPAEGLFLSSVTGSFSVTGPTDIDDAANEGIEIDGADASTTFSFATVDIDNTGGNGIDLDGIDGTFTIASSGGGVAFSSATNAHGVIVNNSNAVSISGTDPGGSNTCKSAPATCFTIDGAGTGTNGALPANGVTATSVTTLSLRFIEITNIGEAGNTAADNEDGINVDDGITTFSLSDSYIHTLSAETGAFESRDTPATSGYSGTVTMTFTDNIIEGNGTDHTSTDESIFIDFDTSTGATLLCTIDNNVFDGVRAGPNIDPKGDSGTGAGGRNEITITRNTIQNIDQDGIAPDIGGDSATATNSNTKIVIGGPNVSDGNILDAIATAAYAGADPDGAIEVELRTNTSGAVLDVIIQNNTIRSTQASGTAAAPIDIWDDRGITVETASSGTTTTGTVRVLIQDNNIDDTDNEGIAVGPDESMTMDARIIDNILGNNVATAGTDEGILVRIRETGSDAPTLRVFFSGNESGTGAAQPWEFNNPFFSSGTFELGCTDAGGGLCANGTVIGSSFASATPASTIEGILDGEGNTTGGGSTNLTLDTSPSGGAIHIVDESTISMASQASFRVLGKQGAAPRPSTFIDHDVGRDLMASARNNLDALAPTTVEPALLTMADRKTTFITRPRPAASGENISLPVGTLAPGQTATILFDVTVDAQTPPFFTQVCNQGTVSGNFADVLTDDPAVGGPNDETCTLAALDPGTIIIEKETNPGGGTGFGFTDDIEAPNNFTLDDGGTKTFTNVPPGAYMVTENNPSGGFLLTGLDCDDDASTTPSTVNSGTRTATINLDPGETVTCTFSNNAIPTNCPDDVLLSNFQTTPSDDQFVDVTNVGTTTIIIDNCSHTAFNVFTETTLGAATVALSGALAPSETFRVGSAGASGVDAVIPDGALPAGPGALVLLDAPPPPDGTPVGVVLPDDITGMVYLSSTFPFGVAHLRVPAHNAIYTCIYGGGFPFTPVASCLGSPKRASEAAPADLLTMMRQVRTLAVEEAENEIAEALPEHFVLQPNYPNPFNPETTIRFGLPEEAEVKLVVYDVLGRQVQVLIEGARAAGWHEVVFEASGLPSGFYVYRLETPRGGFAQTMQLVK